MKNKPLVSVSMITYNHESFIKEAIEGVLMQETNFDYELVIADDCSPDRTQEIVNELILNHPKGNIIRYFRHSKNIGMSANGVFAHEKCIGKYIAVCEGDDYWIDPKKLQKQVDFLELNENYSMCFHNATESLNGLMSATPYTKEIKSEFTIEDFIGPHIVATASIVFRNNINIPEWSNQIFSGDKLLIFLCFLNGRIYFINEIMSHYRVHDQGMSRSEHANGINKVFEMSKLYIELNKYTNRQYEQYFKKGLEYEIGVHILDTYRKELKTKLLIKEIFIRLGIKYFNYKRKS